MSRQRRKQRRTAARRPWWRPLVGLGLLAGWLAVSKRGRQAVKAAKEQTAKATRKLAAAPLADSMRSHGAAASQPSGREKPTTAAPTASLTTNSGLVTR